MAEKKQLADVVICDLCDSNRFSPMFNVGTWHLVCCTDCGLVFTSPRYTADAIAAIYTNEYYQRTPAYYHSQMSPPSTDDLKLASVARRALGYTRPQRSLDLGCGSGRLVEAFRLLGFEARGIEPNEMAVQAGRQCGRNVALMALAEIPERSQHCITAMHVLEHTYSPKGFLVQCHRILSDRGLLILEVPNFASSASRRLKEHWQPLYPDTHLYQFAPGTLTSYLTVSGFEVLSIRKIGGGGFVHAAGEPAGDPADNDSVSDRGRRIKDWIWNNRHCVYRIPYAQDIVRYFFWQSSRSETP